MMNVFADIKYVLTEDEYNQYEATNTLLKRFAVAFGKMTAPYQTALTEANYIQTVNLVIEHIAKDWERHLFSNCRFNQLGALRLDKDVRGMVAFLSHNTQWSTRDKFVRLNQMCTLLNIEHVGEMAEYWGPKAGAINWRFSANEVRKILLLRVDFSQDEVARLIL
eukprot:jgi/Hompol1/2057/HPOL_002041-RA